MKTLLTQLFCAALLWTRAAPAEPNPSWSADFDKTMKSAPKAGRPVLLDFSATWCGPCQIMARTTLQDSNVTQKLESFLKVKVDIDANPLLAQQFGVHAVPTFVVVNDGEEIARTTGGMDATSFGEWLNGALSSAAISAVRRESFEKEKAALAAQLKQTDPASQAKAVGLLLDYSLRKEKYYRDFAEANLKSAATRNPSAFLDYLNHEKLAVRILAGNCLRQGLGPQFVFDPWANAPARAVVIKKWKARLAAKSNPYG